MSRVHELHGAVSGEAMLPCADDELTALAVGWGGGLCASGCTDLGVANAIDTNPFNTVDNGFIEYDSDDSLHHEWEAAANGFMGDVIAEEERMSPRRAPDWLSHWLNMALRLSVVYVVQTMQFVWGRAPWATKRTQRECGRRLLTQQWQLVNRRLHSLWW